MEYKSPMTVIQGVITDVAFETTKLKQNYESLQPRIVLDKTLNTFEIIEIMKCEKEKP